MRRVLKSAVWAAGALVVLGIVLLALLHTPPMKRYALRKLEGVLQAQGIGFHAASLDYNLLALSATLRNVDFEYGATSAQIARVSVNAGWWGLLRGAYVIEEAAIDRPRIRLVLAEQRGGASAGASGGGMPEIAVRRLRVNQGSLVAEDHGQKLAVALPRWDAAVDGDQVRFDSAAPGSITDQGRTMPIDAAALRASVTARGADIARAEVRLEQSELKVSGKVENLAKPVLHLNASAHLALGQLAQFAGMEQDVAGALDLEAAITGPASGPAIEAKARGKQLAYENFRRVNLAADAAYDGAASRVVLRSLTIESPSGNVHGSGSLALTDRAGTSTLEARIDSADLERVSRELKLPVAIAGRARGKVSARWPGVQFGRADAQADVTLAATRSVPAESVAPLSGSAHIETHDGGLEAAVRSLDTLGVNVHGKVTLAGNRLGGRIDADIADVGATVSRAEAFLGRPQGSLVGTPVGGAAHAAVELAGTTSAPEAALSLDAPAMRAGGLDGIAISAEAGYTPKEVALRTARVRWQGQELTAQGTVGLSGAQPLSLSATLSDGSIADALNGLGKGDLPVGGTVSATAEIRGTMREPQGSMHLSATELAAYGEPLGKLTARAALDNNVVRLDSLRWDKQPGGVLEAGGAYDLSTRAYSLKIRGNGLRFTGLTLPGSVPVRGTFEVAADGSGDVAQPNLTLSLNASGVQVKDQGLGELSLRASVANNVAHIEFAAPKYSLNADARAGIRAPYALEITALANQTDLSKLPLSLASPLTGAVTAVVRADGDLEHWRNMQATARISGLNATWQGQTIRNEGPIQLTQDRDVIYVEPATLAVGETQVTLDGTLPGALHVTAASELERLAALLPPSSGIALCGRLMLDATLKGSLEKIDPEGTLTVRGGCIEAPQLGRVSNVNVTAKAAGGSLTIESAAAEWASAKIQASGEVPFGLFGELPLGIPQKQGPARLEFDAAGLTLAGIHGIPEKTSGTISLHVEASAAKPELAAVTGHIRFDQLDLDVSGISLKQQEPVLISAAGSEIKFDRFHLTGPQTHVNIAGSAGLMGAQPLDLRLDAQLDAALLAAFAPGMKAAGDTRVQVAVGGSVERPEFKGSVELAKAQFSMAEPSLAAHDLNARLDFGGDRLTITRFTSSLNGGTLDATGGISYRDGALRDAGITAKLAEVYIDYPQGLRTLSSGDIYLKSREENLVLGGRIHILEGSYTDEITLEKMLSAAGSGSEVELSQERNPTLERVRFDVGVDTQSPLIVQNNLAKLAASMDLRLGGTFYRPGVTGRITLGDGGELYLNERTYLVDRGVITFTNDQRIEPTLDIAARTKVSGYDITLTVSGTPADLKTNLTSDPPESEPSIIALLVTGRTLDQVSGSELTIAQQQVLSYVTGRAGDFISRQAEKALGLSKVRIDPNLISAESDPTARLTIGQDLTKDLSLVYSTNLTDSQDQIWIAEYDLTKRFITRAIRQSDNSYRLEFNNSMQFGSNGARDQKSAAVEQREVGSVSFSGNTRFDSAKLAKVFGVKAGDKYDFFKVRKGLERLNEFYAKQRLLETRVRMERSASGGKVDLKLDVAPGPEVTFVYEGWDPPGGTKDKVSKAWSEGVFDAQRLTDAEDALRRALIERRYLEESISHTVSEPEEGHKRVLFEIQPGIRFGSVRLAFKGAEGIDASELKDVLEQEKLRVAVYTEPQKVTEFLSGYYRDHGYLDAKVERPQYELDRAARTGQVVIAVHEGPLYRIGKMQFTGNEVYSDAELQKALSMQSQAEFLPEQRQAAITKLQDLYWQKGFQNVEISYSIEKRPDLGLVDVNYRLKENRQRVVQAVEIKGTAQTSKSLVASQVALKPGEVLNNEETGKARQNLYSTGAYSMVDIQAEPMENAGGGSLGPNQEPVRLKVNVREIKPFAFTYGGFYDTERGPGVVADLVNRNSLGGARQIGMRMRYDADIHEGRLYFSQPLLRSFPLKTDAVGYMRREFRTDFITDRLGFSAQQETHFARKLVWTYGYRIERTHTYDRGPDPLFDATLRIAPLRTTLARETRNEFLDSTQGSFLSQALEYGPSFLGSQLRFLRYYGQFFKYVPLSAPVEVPLSGGKMRTRLVYAGGVRVGLAGGLGGQAIVPSERFFAGGGTTIRGFDQDSVGPTDYFGDPAGGNATFIVNNELRFPVLSIFDGVGFVDIGNVYPRVVNFNPFDVRASAGLGLRVRTPYVLLRLDYGIKLDRRPGEGFGKLFFSIGQAY
jgi:outer membrane protein assembly complex protein YaeT